MTVTTNVKAPDFELVSHKGEKVRLADLLAQGPVVLAFFPLAFTGVCTTEMCEFRDMMAEFAGLDAHVLGLSVDSRFALQAFAEKNNLDFPLLSDFNKEVGKAYGVLYEDFLGMHGVHKRSLFVVDREGTVRYSWVSEQAGVKPDLGPVKETLKALKAS
ncbi:MAG: peroxiredoxin [Candidatus Eremiobacterota bacterium]